MIQMIDNNNSIHCYGKLNDNIYRFFDLFIESFEWKNNFLFIQRTIQTQAGTFFTILNENVFITVKSM